MPPEEIVGTSTIEKSPQDIIKLLETLMELVNAMRPFEKGETSRLMAQAGLIRLNQVRSELSSCVTDSFGTLEKARASLEAAKKRDLIHLLDGFLSAKEKGVVAFVNEIHAYLQQARQAVGEVLEN